MLFPIRRPFYIKKSYDILRPVSLWAALLLSLASCNVTRHLDKDKGERLLVGNALHVDAGKKLSLTSRLKFSYELAPLYRQKPNTRMFGMFYTRVWLYYKYRNKTSKFAKWMMAKQVEKPAVYDPSLAKRTASNFQNQMRQRGYFRATCSYTAKEIGAKKAKVHYDVKLGPLYTISRVDFVSKDTQVLEIVRMLSQGSYLKPGSPLDGQLFEAEKLRLTSELKSRGYALFVQQFIEYTGDSTGTNASVRVEILPFNDSTMHQQYTIGKVEVYTGVVPELTVLRSDTTINGVYFAAVEPKFFVRPDRIYQTIEVRPGQIYNQNEFDNTLRNLNGLGVYKFVSVRSVPDSTRDGVMDVAVNLSPNKRFSFGGGVDFNYSTLKGGLIGISPSFSVNNRNIFSGAENLRSTANYNIEFDISTQRFIYAQEFKLQNELAFPRYFDYLGVWRLLHNIHLGRNSLLPDKFYNRVQHSAKARIAGNYNYLRVTDFYQYHLFNASFGYQLQASTHHQYSWDHFSIEVLRPKFDANLNPNAFLRLSFDDQLFTGFLLRSFNYTYNSRINGFGERWTYRLTSELSGLEILAANRAWGAAFGKESWKFGVLNYSEFFRLDQDLVYTRSFSKNLAGAVRIGMGIARPFGDSETVPYVKQFFVGGPSSLRAWRIREIGPGSYLKIDPLTGRPDTTQPFIQAADFRFEFNGELRFPIFSYFKGAIFVDCGNIWTVKKDSFRPGSELRWDSFRNIAIGTGFGVRGDFSYFIIRLDFGLPLRRPYKDPDSGSYWVKKLVSGMKLTDFNPNLAVGLPF